MTIHFYIRQSNTGTSPIQIAVTHKGQRFRNNIGVNVDPKKWNAKRERSGNIQIDDYLVRLRNELEASTNALSTIEEVKNELDRVLHGISTPKRSDSREPFWQYYHRWTFSKEGVGAKVRRASYKLAARLMGTTDNWDDIDEAWHYRLMQKMDKEDYSENYKTTVTKCIRGVLLAGSRDGLYDKMDEWKKMRKRWETADTIYLTQKEVDKLWRLKLPLRLSQVRDLFIIGIYSAARFQNYSKFTMNNIKGRNLEFVQIKTGEKVVIPASPRLIAALERNGGKSPKVSLNDFNKYLKYVCEIAGITEETEIRKHRGGKYLVEKTRRCDLVSSHTARRTGATLLYLSGVPITLCRFLTGHSSDEMFMRYIKIRREEAADKLRDNPFFK